MNSRFLNFKLSKIFTVKKSNNKKVQSQGFASSLLPATNYSIGHQAETIASDYLSENGFKIKELNWKTRFCEIDIVAEKDKTIHFVEVKSRSTHKQGEGFEYITDRKVWQMAYAAEFWVSKNNWDGSYQLSALSIDSGKITFLKDI